MLTVLLLQLIFAMSAVGMNAVPFTASPPNGTDANGVGSQGKTKLIIDTDAVSDDVRAISLALQHPKAEVIAISTTHGCVNVDQATANVIRTLRANNVTRKIPVYKGAAGPLIRDAASEEEFVTENIFFGKDGLGDEPEAWPRVETADFNSHQSEVAALALIRLTKEHPDATLVCLGPLTNIALAIKLDRNFVKQPRNVVIMGGNFYGIGNVDSTGTAEFNFHGDPEAAAIVLREMNNLTLVPWEAFFLEGPKHAKEVDFDAHLKTGTALAGYLSTATKVGRDILAKNDRQYTYCDEIAMATAISPLEVIHKKTDLRVNVELAGKFTRGQVAVDWVDVLWSNEDEEYVAEQGKRINRSRQPVTFVSSYNVKVVDDWMIKTTSGKW